MSASSAIMVFEDKSTNGNIFSRNYIENMNIIMKECFLSSGRGDDTVKFNREKIICWWYLILDKRVLFVEMNRAASQICWIPSQNQLCKTSRTPYYCFFYIIYTLMEMVFTQRYFSWLQSVHCKKTSLSFENQWRVRYSQNEHSIVVSWGGKAPQLILQI